MFQKIMFNFAVIVALLMLTGCSTKTDYIEESKYIEIWTELELIHALMSQNVDTDRTNELIDSVWERYDVTKEKFIESHYYYESDTEQQLKRVKIVIDRLSSIQNDLELKLHDLREDERREQQRIWEEQNQ